ALGRKYGGAGASRIGSIGRWTWPSIEDRCHIRAGHAAENIAIIRRFALNLLKLDKIGKLGVKNKRLRMACDTTYRSRVLIGNQENTVTHT
ncbi:MAG: hypothetical protein LBF93_07040, partial [Zoogloeaceae bacterium]|nr:hypothetical protein [Zoogloeaceae bacterium]